MAFITANDALLVGFPLGLYGAFIASVKFPTRPACVRGVVILGDGANGGAAAIRARWTRVCPVAYMVASAAYLYAGGQRRT